MKILLTSFYDLGKQPKIIAEIVDKYKSENIEFDIVDFSIDNPEINIDQYDVLGIYAPMHTATVLSIEFLKNKTLPKKVFTFGLYGSVLEDFNSSIKHISNIENGELDSFLDINKNKVNNVNLILRIRQNIFPKVKPKGKYHNMVVSVST